MNVLFLARLQRRFGTKLLTLPKSYRPFIISLLPWLKNFSEFYLVFKGLPSIGQNQFWRDGLKMWMKASIGFCPQRADLILLTDEVRGRAGFLRPQVEANQGGEAPYLHHTWGTVSKPESQISSSNFFFYKKYAKGFFFGHTPFSATAIFGKEGFTTVFLGPKNAMFSDFCSSNFPPHQYCLDAVWMRTGWYPF